MHSLERVGLVLPPAVQLQPHLDTAENHFLASLKVDAKLHDVAIVNGKRLALLRGWAQPDVVEERAGRALDVLDVPLAVLVPKLAVAAAHHLALKAHGSRRALPVGQGMAVALGVTTNANDFGAVGQRPGDGWEGQRWPRGSGVVVCRESDGRLVVGRARPFVGSGHGWMFFDG